MTEIVVGIDGSESSQRALEWAAEEARLRGAHLKIVHAWFDWFVATGYFSAPAMYETSAIEESGRAMLEKAAASIPAGSPELDVEAALVHGRPESVLLNASQEADMVVVGSRWSRRHRRPPARFSQSTCRPLGHVSGGRDSVGEGVMKPVAPDIRLDHFDSLVVACDFTAMSDRMLPIVGGLARRGDLPVQMVTTASPGLEEYDLKDLGLRGATDPRLPGDGPRDRRRRSGRRHRPLRLPTPPRVVVPWVARPKRARQDPPGKHDGGSAATSCRSGARGRPRCAR